MPPILPPTFSWPAFIIACLFLFGSVCIDIHYADRAKLTMSHSEHGWYALHVVFSIMCKLISLVAIIVMLTEG